jgi:hypothetical protein
VETGGVLRVSNRGWLISSPGIGGVGQDLILEGEISPGSQNDSWRAFIYANVAPAGGQYNENTDGLRGAWHGYGVPDCWVSGAGNVDCNGGAGGPTVGGAWKGFRMTTIQGGVQFEMWDLANPTDAVNYQSSYTKTSNAGERILFYNREHVGTMLLDNVRVLAVADCNGNGVSDLEDIESGLSADCDQNGVPDECQVLANPGTDLNQNGVLDTCECTTSNYCQADPNSVGTTASIGWQGELSLAANNYSLSVVDAPPLKFGIFFYGANQAQLPVGDGQLCVALDVQRIQPLVITNQSGAAVLPVDFTSPAFSSGAFAVAPFSTWNFQFWYRDPQGGPSGFNFSNGLEATFCP